MTTSGYLYVIKKNGSFGSEYRLLKNRVYNLGSDFRCHLRFPLEGFFGTACSISTNKTDAVILKKLASYRVLLNSGVITSPKKLKFGDVFQVGNKVFKWDRLKHNSVQKSTYLSKAPGPGTSTMSAKKEVRRKSVGDFRPKIKSSTKSALSTWKETNENVTASSSEFSKTKRSSKYRNNQKLVISKSEIKPRENPSKIPRIQSVTKRQLKLNINIPKHVDSNQHTPTLNTKDLPPQLKPESIKKAQSLKKSMEIALLSKRKHLDDSFVKMSKKIKLSKDFMDESAGDHLVDLETSNFDDSLPIAPDSPLTISPRRSVRVDASPTINSRKSLFNDHNVSGIATLMETPPRKVNTSEKSSKQELNESLNIFETSLLNKKASGSKSTGKKLKQPAKLSRFSLSTRKAPRSRLISVKTKTPTQLPIALKSVSVVKKSSKKSPKVKTTPIRSASKRLSKMYKSPKSPAIKTSKKEVSFSISPKGKGSPDASTPINVPIKTSPRRSSANNSFNLNPLLNGSPMKSPKNSPKTSTSLARSSSTIKTSGKSSQNNSFNLSPILNASPVKTPKNSPKTSTSSGRVSTSAQARKINVSAKKISKTASPIKTSPRRSFQNNVLNLVALFEGDSATKARKISPNVSTARISTSRTPKMNLSAKKTPAKSSSIFTPIRNSLSSRKIIKLEALKARQTRKNTSPMKTPAKSSPIKTPVKSSPIKTPVKSSAIKTPPQSYPTVSPIWNSLSSRKIIKLEALKARQTRKNTSPMKTPAKSSPIKTPVKSSAIKTPAQSYPTVSPIWNSLSSRKIIKLEALEARQIRKNTSPMKTPAKSSPIKTPVKSSPIKTPAQSYPTVSPIWNSLSSRKIIKLEALKSRQTRKNTSPIKTPAKSSPIKTPVKSSVIKTPAKSSSMKTPVRNSLSSKRIIKLEALKSKQTPKNASPVKTELSTRRSSQNIAFNFSGLFEDSPTKTPNFKASRSVRISASPRNSFSPKKTPQIASRIQTSPRSPKNSPKVSTSSARTSTSAKKSPIKISPRRSENNTLNLDALFDISSTDSPVKAPARTLAQKTPKLSVSATKAPSANKGLVEISPLKTPKNNRNVKNYTSPHKTPQINISDQLIQFSPPKTPKVGVASTSTVRTSTSAVLCLTPTNKTLQQISPVLTSTGKVKKSSRKNTPLKLSATKTKTLKNELFNSSSELLFKTPTQRTTPARTRSTRKAPKSPSTIAMRLSMEEPIENVSFSFVTPINSPAAVQRISKTPTLQIKNSPNISAKIKKSPKNDLTDVKGVKSLMKTSGRQQRSPKNDLTDVKGVKSLMKTPARQQRSPKNDLTDVKGVKSLLKTPGRQQRSPKNDLTDVKGVKSLMKTPGRQQRSPKNDLTDVKGVKSLMRTPGKKQQKSPQNDLSDLRGVKKLMNPLRSPKSPLNDLTNITSVKNLFRTSTGHVKSPTNDLTNVQGVKRLMNSFRSPKNHANDLTDVEGVKELFNSPATVQLTRQSVEKSQVIKPLVRSTGKNITTPDMNNLLFDSIKGTVDGNTRNFELRKSIITYERKNKTLSPVKQPLPRTSNRQSLQSNVVVNYASIQKWVDECTPAANQILPIKSKREEPTVLTPTTRRKARLLREEDCTPTPEQAKPARKIVSRRKVAIATDITVTISEIVVSSPQRTRKRLANVETEKTDSAKLKKSKRVQFEEPASSTPESSPRSKRGRSALKQKVEKGPEVKPIRGRRKAAKKEEEPSPQEEVTKVKVVRGRRKAVKNVEEKEEPIQQEKIEVEIRNVRGRRKAMKKVEENEEPAQQETIEVNTVRGRRKAAKKVEEKEEPIQEEKSVRGRRNASKKQVDKENEPSTQEESKPVRKIGRPAKDKNSNKENVTVKSPQKSNSPAIKKKGNKEEKVVKTTRATRTTKKVTEGKESAEVEKKKPTRDNKTVPASQEEKEIPITRTTRKKAIVEETSPKPAPRTTRRKK